MDSRTVTPPTGLSVRDGVLIAVSSLALTVLSFTTILLFAAMAAAKLGRCIHCRIHQLGFEWFPFAARTAGSLLFMWVGACLAWRLRTPPLPAFRRREKILLGVGALVGLQAWAPMLLVLMIPI